MCDVFFPKRKTKTWTSWTSWTNRYTPMSCSHGASWTWNGGWDADEVTITVVGHFLCRDDTSSWTLPVSDVVYLTQAFDSLVTYPGQALTLIATPNVSQFGNAEWYRNGVGVQEGPGDYHIAAMTAAAVRARLVDSERRRVALAGRVESLSEVTLRSIPLIRRALRASSSTSWNIRCTAASFKPPAQWDRRTSRSSGRY